MNSLTSLETRNDLADFLRIPRKKLSYILFIKKPDSYYSTFQLPKKSGGYRTICAPKGDLKTLQRKLLSALSNHVENSPYINLSNNKISNAFQKGKDITTNALIHAKKRFVLNIDLENYFDSFHFGRVQGYFMKNKSFLLSEEIATTIAQIACYQGHLPQGSPCSPIITNLISQILDTRLLKISKEYKVDYTRYADDLTFSTNRRDFLQIKDAFLEKVESEIIHSGFTINAKKTRIQCNTSRQEVTGLTVNTRPNVNIDYIKKTRAMAHSLYSNGKFYIDGKQGTLNQLQGRFSFICNINKKCKPDWAEKAKFSSSTTKEYRRFIFYKQLFASPFPVIVTEGKTDVTYIKAALMKNHEFFPNLVQLCDDGSFKFKVFFWKRDKKTTALLSLDYPGGNSLYTLYKEYAIKQEGKKHSLLGYFKKLSGKSQAYPILFLLDNETKRNDAPLKQILKSLKKENMKIQLQNNLSLSLSAEDKLYLLTVPLVDGKEECVIEDLFTKETRNIIINGRNFSMEKIFDPSHHYGKNEFSNMIIKNYKTIDFSRFLKLLEAIDTIVSNNR